MREGFLLFDDHVITCGSWGGGGCVEIFYTLWVCIANRFHITAVVRWIVYIFLRLERSLVLFRGWWWWWRNILLSDLLGGNLRIQPWFSTTKRNKNGICQSIKNKYLFFPLQLTEIKEKEIKKPKTNKSLGKWEDVSRKVIHLSNG